MWPWVECRPGDPDIGPVRMLSVYNVAAAPRIRCVISASGVEFVRAVRSLWPSVPIWKFVANRSTDTKHKRVCFSLVLVCLLPRRAECLVMSPCVTNLQIGTLVCSSGRNARGCRGRCTPSRLQCVQSLDLLCSGSIPCLIINQRTSPECFGELHPDGFTRKTQKTDRSLCGLCWMPCAGARFGRWQWRCRLRS